MKREATKEKKRRRDYEDITASGGKNEQRKTCNGVNCAFFGGKATHNWSLSNNDNNSNIYSKIIVAKE